MGPIMNQGKELMYTVYELCINFIHLSFVLHTFWAKSFILYIHISQQVYVEPCPQIYIALLQYAT